MGVRMPNTAAASGWVRKPVGIPSGTAVRGLGVGVPNTSGTRAAGRTIEAEWVWVEIKPAGKKFVKQAAVRSMRELVVIERSPAATKSWLVCLTESVPVPMRLAGGPRFVANRSGSNGAGHNPRAV